MLFGIEGMWGEGCGRVYKTFNRTISYIKEEKKVIEKEKRRKGEKVK